MLDAYLPLVFLFGLAALFAVGSAAAAPYIGPRRYNKAKLDAYECGIEPSPEPVTTAGRTPVHFYQTALLFIIFDIEIVFLYPYAVAADSLGLFGFVAMAIFLATIGIAYAYEWARGGLEWR